MLQRLYVKNVALISEANIEFDSGLNVLSGETGSGKSVILDSINFVLGSKADRTMIRFGESEALVKAEFIVPKDSSVLKILDNFDIESDGTVIISRKFSADGRSSIKINGNPVTVAMLKSITQHLVDVHGQSEHFFLLNEDNQLKVIDGLLGDESDKIKFELSKLISEKKEYKTKINALGGDEAERARRLDLLEFEINEIENAELKIGEMDELKTRQSVIQNLEKILNAINCVKDILDSDGGCSDGLNTARHEMERISHIGEDYAGICSRLEAVNTEISDISETLSDLSESLTFDENEARNIEDRISLIKNLIKKYGATEEDILSFKDRAKAEYDAVSEGAVAVERYTKKIEECDDKIYSLCLELTALRKKVADKFCKDAVKELVTLNIPNARFGVRFNEYDRQNADLQSSDGCDRISFEFSANKGEPLKPLNKVISGGEMSRFMLAVKTCLKDLNGISTYIFDEIDAGISGYTAGTVAAKFRKIAENTQILAVSHLPQVCAASDRQFLIYKVEEDGKTLTRIKKLTDTEKIDEIARLTGNVLSETARKHATELINQIKNN